MIEVKTLSSFDNFFYYGKNDIESEIESDVMQTVIQPIRSMFFFRRNGAGITNKENFPNSLNLQVLLRYDIASSIAYRNTYVTDGSDNTRDRRIAASQFSIEFFQKGGELDVKIYYFNFANTKKLQSMIVPAGGVA